MVLVLTNGTLIDGTGRAPANSATVGINVGEWERVGKGKYEIEAG
jgi:N-acyl-D-aspartate/D-glutamate deacylase